MPDLIKPIVFSSLYKQLVWGGRAFETLYGRSLPEHHSPYGESWELSGRIEDQSLVLVTQV